MPGKLRMDMWRYLSFLLISFAAGSTACLAADSSCYGIVSKGRLENGVQLPVRGKNFSAYSEAGHTAGRTYVHGKVSDVVLAAYAALEHAAPGKIFVYGETGREKGGPITPHRTHQNGLSEDFMVPIMNQSGQSLPLPTSAANKYGYDIDFDAQGRFGEFTIDFEAMAEQLYQLSEAARQKISAFPW